ncbi:hypothetical protein V5P93_005097 [Actinokineospora auranticolor]|uniref:Uncharacterized protein n=1 Tax=Actinokineospora auranticolor TaxID=155976 RepID=A0A2S6GK80_9PSEU|nr:hypothetical protein [Actinokineospora auranticolor]PPK65627.1 hypothetical protein CLV40_113111 [Actinokineospora auranticolor]
MEIRVVGEASAPFLSISGSRAALEWLGGHLRTASGSLDLASGDPDPYDYVVDRLEHAVTDGPLVVSESADRRVVRFTGGPWAFDTIAATFEHVAQEALDNHHQHVEHLPIDHPLCGPDSIPFVIEFP